VKTPEKVHTNSDIGSKATLASTEKLFQRLGSMTKPASTLLMWTCFLAEISTLSQAVLLITPKVCSLQMTTSKVENSAQVSSC